jgi:Carboxypeptidase regulatory-like domain/TonB dependent receptor/TonB-dependent Receptor Plug Domain
MPLLKRDRLANGMTAILLLLVSAHVGAQAVTGSLFGAVTDASGSRLPGVTVTASSPQLISGQEVRTTSDQGVYRFPTLPPGTYTITFDLSGFQPLEQRNVVLLAGQSLAVDGQLQVSRINESVTVVATAPLIDTRNAALMNTADAVTLQNIPVPRNFTDILNIMPGVTDGLYDFSRVNNVHGGTTRQNVYNLDGVNTDDPNTNAPVTDLAPDAFQEVQVTTAGIAAEFGDASGGVFNYITKSGGNTFNGGANYFYQTKGLEADNVPSSLQQIGVAKGGFEHVYDRGVLLGGPILRNRAWFFGNYRDFDQSERRSDFRGAISTTDKQLFSKGTVQLPKNNKVETSFFFRDYLNFPFTSMASFRNSADDRTWLGVEKKNYITTPRWTSVLGNNTVIEARGSFAFLRLLATTPNNVGAPAYIDQATGVLSGGDDQTFGDNNRNRHQFKADVSHFREGLFGGNHSFKTGFDWQRGPVFEQRFLSGARGPSELAGCAHGSECISVTPDTQHLLFNGTPFRVRLWNTPRLQHYETRRWAYYAQDQVVFHDRFTIDLGLRFDHVNGFNPESTGGGGQWETAVTTFPTQSDLVNLTTLAPRLGLVWDVRGDHRSTVKASYGRFYYQINNNHISIASAAGPGYREYDWVDVNGDMIYEPGEERTLRADTRPNPANLPLVDPNLKDQYNDVWTAGFERRLASDLALAVTGIYKREGNLIGLVDLAIPFSAYTPITVINPLTNQPTTIYTQQLAYLGKPVQRMLTNPGERPGDTEPLRRGYKGVEMVLRKRLERRTQFEVSYVLGKGEGNVGNAFSDSNNADYTNPNFLINRFGDLPLGPRHEFKAQGVYLAPWNLVFSGFFQALSGIPWTDTISGSNTVKGAATVRYFKTQYPQIQSETFIDVAAEPAGTRKFDTQTRLDLRAEKRVNVHTGFVSLAVDAFNVLNAGTVVRVRDLRLDSVNFGIPAQLQLPRQVRLVARWVF